MKREIPVGPLQPGEISPGDLDQPLASRFFLAEDDPLIDGFAGPGVSHGFQRDLKPELAPELDLDVADMPGTIDPPGKCRDQAGRHNSQPEEERPSPGSDGLGESGETSLPPGWNAISSRDGTNANPSTQR